MRNYFTNKELYHPEIVKHTPDHVLDVGIPAHARYALNWLREQLGMPIVINGSWKGKKFVDSGVRSNLSTVGAKLSGHKMLRDRVCFDLKCDDQKRLRELIETNWQWLKIFEIEDYSLTPTWTHICLMLDPCKTPIILRIVKWAVKK
jgi:hypothetical protein